MQNPSRDELFESIQAILAGPCGVGDSIQPGSHLFDDLGLDSMGLLALAVSLENEHKIRLDEDADSPPQTVNEVLDLLQLRLAARSKNEEA